MGSIMNSHPQLLNLGQQLKEHRMNRAMSLNQVAEKTKISVDILQAIEEGQYSQFPVYVYLRGFVLSYAQAIEIDPKPLLESLKALLPEEEREDTVKKTTSSIETEELLHQDLRLTPLILAGSILFVLACILIFSNWIRRNKEGFQPQIQQEQAGESKKTANKARKKAKSAAAGTVNSSHQNFLAQDREVEVIIKALEETAFSYSVDGETINDINLKKDQFEVLKGKKKVWIKTKAADKIRIFYNGKDKGRFGAGGKKERTFVINSLEN